MSGAKRASAAPALRAAAALLLAEAAALAALAPAPAWAQPARPPPPSAKPGPKPSLEPPSLERFVEARYPEEAGRAGLEGAVTLQLDIDAEGKVTRALVLDPAGHGFDEAAVEAASRFMFRPASRDGRAVPSRIAYRYTFTLKPKPEPAPSEQQGAERPSEPSTTGALRGVALGAGVVPIEGARVTLRGGGVEREATADARGAFSFEALPPGRYLVRLAPAGYLALEVEEDVAAGQATEVTYRLGSSGGGVVVRGERPAREVTRRTLERRELSRIPGTNGDALRAVQALPGVARPRGGAGALIVRGSSPQDTQVFVDGTPIPIVYHFGGLSSVVPTEMIERLDFYPGNFGVAYGRAMGGLVDVGLREGKNDGRYHGLAQIDLVDARAVLEGPVPLGSGWTFEAGARRSHVDVWLRPVLKSVSPNVTAAPIYDDYQVFAERRVSPRTRVRLGVFGSDDRLDAIVGSARANTTGSRGDVSLATGFVRAQALVAHELSDDIKLSSVTAAGPDKVGLSRGNQLIDVSTWNLSARGELAWRASPWATLDVGYDLGYARYDVDLRIPRPRRAGEPSPGPFAQPRMQSITQSGGLFRPAAYAQAELLPGAGVQIVSGLRADYASETGRWDLSPRLHARLPLRLADPPTTLKGGVGVFHQPLSPQDVLRLPEGASVPSNRAIHYSLGAEQGLSRQIDLSVEGFYKQLDSLVTRSVTSTGVDVQAEGSGYVVGAETLLRYRPDDRFFGWVAYTLSRSMRRPDPGSPLRRFAYDQTHILTVLGSYRLGGGWEFGARFRLVTGTPATPCTGGVYDSSAGSYDCIGGEPPFGDRLPTFHELDVRLDKRWYFEAWQLGVYLDVYNVYNRRNPEGFSYNFDYSQRSVTAGLPLIPSLGVRGEF